MPPNVPPYPVGPVMNAPPYPPGVPLNDPYASGQPPYNNSGSEFAGSRFSDKSIRHAFIRKVYLILTAQLCVTCAFVCLFLLEPTVGRWVRRNSWFYYMSYATFIVTYIALVCCPNVRRRYPGNFIALGVFVYLILTAQLCVTCAFVCLFLLEPTVGRWVRRNSWFYYMSYATFIVTYIALVCCPNVRRRYPGNFIALGVFTLAFSYMTGTIASFYSTSSVLIAIAITAAVCLAISLFAIQTRIDFTKCTALLLVLSLVLLFTGIACMIVYAVSPQNRIMQAVYGGIAALVFALCKFPQLFGWERSFDLHQLQPLRSEMHARD
ncbi:unnamed protein product [Dicrocoelium dendriticum]|nr:unnamed protein product [Dicrocoelium dendriticum]